MKLWSTVRDALPGVAGLLVDVQLEVLVVVHEAPPDLVDGQMEGVLRVVLATV